MKPLADRLRPQSLDEVVGQQHILGKGKLLRRIADSGQLPNMIFTGPPGTGKTTTANILAAASGKRLHKLNATTASLSDVKAVIDEVDTLLAPGGVLLYLDEIQYFNKKQQQALLECVENGGITLIASTTENPYFYVYGALLSRCTVFEFKPVPRAEIVRALRRALTILQSERQAEITATDEALDAIAALSAGDVRKALGALELLAMGRVGQDKIEITAEAAQEAAQSGAVRYDRDSDIHYDLLSAFQKSLRGSDENAALFYLARLLAGGDLPGVCRRLLVTAAEDVGLAYPSALTFCKAAVDTALQVGLPEARIPLADAVILVATAPKSNSGILAIDQAWQDVEQGLGVEVPPHLRDAHYAGAEKLGRGLTYRYPHSFPNHYVKQAYLPADLKNRVYYTPGDNKLEQATRAYWDRIKDEPK